MSGPELRLLTMRLPWTWATVHAGRTTDNRALGWLGVRYRGLVGLLAAKTPDARLRRCVAVEGDRALWTGPTWPAGVERAPASALRMAVRSATGPASLAGLGAYGYVIGVAELVDIHLVATPTCCRPWGERGPSVASRARWPVHLTFAGVRPLWPPIEATGGLGLRVPTPEVAAAILETA